MALLLLMALVAGGFLASDSPLAAQTAPDVARVWNQWRGPGRDGVAAGVDLPETWPAELQRLWQVEVGEGYSSPVGFADRIFVFARQNGEEVIRAVDLDSGETVWRTSYAAPYRVNRAAASHGDGPKSTPIVFDGRVCTLGISGILSCFATGDGGLLWRNDFSDEFPSTSPTYGVAMSPAVVDGHLLVHLGGGGRGSLMALDPASGEVRWSLQSEGPGYASPVLAEVGGRRQIVTQSAQRIIGVAPEGGDLLWEIPFTTPFNQNIVTPILAGERLIFSGLQQTMFAIELVEEGGGYGTLELWSNDRLPMYMSSPVLVGGRLFGFSNMRRGQFFCLDPATGEAIWTSEGRAGDNAALVVAGDQLLALTSDAELYVIDPAAAEFTPVARYEVADSATYAHPLLTQRGILIKDHDAIALWSW